MVRKFNPDGLYTPETYWNAVEVPTGTTLVYSSGIVGIDAAGNAPADPRAQIDLAWANVAGFLRGAGLTTDGIVRLTMHYANRDIIELSREARIRTLGDHMDCAVMGVVADLMDPEHVIEIEVICARS